MKVVKDPRRSDSSRHMKVLMASTYSLDRKSFRSGPQVATHALVQSLAKMDDIEVDVVTIGSQVQQDWAEREDGVRMYYLASPRPKLVSSLVRDIPCVEAKIRKLDPDVVHAKDAVYAIAGLQAGYPTVLTLHGLRLLHHGHQFRPHASFIRNLLTTNWRYLTLQSPMAATWCQRIQAIVATNALISALHKLSAVIVVSSFAMQQVADLTKARLYLIENPVEKRYFNVPNLAVSGRLLMVGRVSPGKGILYAAQALARLARDFPHAHLHIVGPVADSTYHQAVVQFARENEVDDRIEFLGFLDADGLVEALAKCSLLLMPSTHENSPNAIGQAMAAGKPTVAFDVGGIPERVQRGETGYLVPFGDVEGLAARVGQLLSDDALRIQLGQNSRARAFAQFHPDKVAQQTVAVYQELLN